MKECHVIEKDPRFIPTLNLIKNSLGDDNLQVSIGDCLHFNISSEYLTFGKIATVLISKLVDILNLNGFHSWQFFSRFISISVVHDIFLVFSERLEGRVTPAEWESPLKPNLVLFGNLPFNVATPFIIKLLKEMSERTNYYAFGRMPAVLTFQVKFKVSYTLQYFNTVKEGYFGTFI